MSSETANPERENCWAMLRLRKSLIKSWPELTTAERRARTDELARMEFQRLRALPGMAHWSDAQLQTRARQFARTLPY